MNSINKLFLGALVFLSLLVRDSFSAAKVPEDIDFSRLNVLSKFAKNVLDNGAEEDSSTPSIYSDADSISERFSRLELYPTKTYVLNFYQDGMDDDAFSEITQSLLPELRPKEIKCAILDLSFNCLTAKSAAHLKEWRDTLGCDFINLNGNSDSSKKNIARLCKTLETLEKGDKQKVSDFMSHIIFLPQYYIYQASTRVQIYRQLLEEGYLPRNWADRHREYYKKRAGAHPISFSEETWDTDPDQSSSLRDFDAS
ncbi:MAG: hypothetical protein A2621_02035 [Alphaproteobacteria bacterium RIFCSPHIGHO2_01_FULL_41_14]|nr:MAG: hypothetical protein A2065_03220 [Alphaproteobacteria bacterium GWB1_45_5]OFW76582.1 MAG: hypothetical protein A3K20_00145 [Alphaproteobacteria bacterium GWA1_45_9]OFW89666.1 MAG: hypothetical protein A2621_02035 [Alphaproteobacteria bacterium RIFCSPHIGHO2_01_FULL_41_14]HCI49107.1 hypothetical protein [Holosporales bacterium]